MRTSARSTAAQGEVAVAWVSSTSARGFRDEGATSVEAWTAERFGVSVPTARVLTHVGEKAWDLPHLVGCALLG